VIVLLFIPFESTPVLDLIIAGLFVPGTLMTAMLVPFHLYPDFAYGMRAVLNIVFWSILIHWLRNRIRARRLKADLVPE
jgi:hypothetical protein